MKSNRTTETDRVQHPLPERCPTLRLVYSADRGILSEPARALSAGITPIGRSLPANEGIGLYDDRRASRLHATLHVEPMGEAVRLLDADSKNGTFVNGQRVSEQPLQDGDVIHAGSSFLILRYEEKSPTDTPIAGMLGVSPTIRQVRTRIAQIAPAQASVLILGESGTGKELAAHALHAQSGCSGPFVALNCAAIPESLAESQLFGHAAGAFTGARTGQLGFFRAAHQGTLFMDEVGELPPSLQPKLLRALEERSVVPVGTTQPVACEVRLVAATNRDLTAAERAGQFRGDLYARLATYTLSLPPLRARREDILPILAHALAPGPVRLTPALVEALLLHPFPYNVRELLALVSELRLAQGAAAALDLPMIAERLAKSRASLSAPGATASTPFTSGELALSEEPGAPPAGKPQPKRPVAKDELVALMRQHHGLIAKVARAAGRSRRQIMRWLEQHGLSREDFTK